jgi:hypothetical protein
MPQAGNPITRTRAVTRITRPHTHSPVGLGRSSVDGSCGNFGVDSGSGSGFGSACVLTLALDTCLSSVLLAALGSDKGFGSGCSFRLGSCASTGSRMVPGVDVGVGGVPNGRKASQDLVSALTCIPYLIPACLAVVQVKNLSPLLGLKF